MSGLRFISNEAIARMQRRHGYQGETTVSTDQNDGPQRRRRDTSGIQSRSDSIHSKVSQAVDQAEEGLRRKAHLDRAAIHPEDQRRSTALQKRGGQR